MWKTILAFATGGWSAVLELLPLALEYWREVLIVVLAAWIILGGALHDRKVGKLRAEIDEIQGECSERIMALRRSGERCLDNLGISQSNGLAMEIALQRQRSEIEGLRLEQLRRRRVAEERVSDAESKRRSSELYAEELHRRITAEDECSERVRVAVAGVWEMVLATEAAGGIEIEEES